ncbi:MAG: hypothetical protein U0905_12670 [Pirellulales bacterium]
MYQRIIQTACFHFIVVGFASLTMGQAPLHSQESGTDSSWLRSTSPAAYKILPRPTHHATVPATQQPTLRVRPMQPYAYGWFGTEASPDWSRHFGVKSAYTQWTRK